MAEALWPTQPAVSYVAYCDLLLDRVLSRSHPDQIGMVKWAPISAVSYAEPSAKGGKQGAGDRSLHAVTKLFSLYGAGYSVTETNYQMVPRAPKGLSPINYGLDPNDRAELFHSHHYGAKFGAGVGSNSTVLEVLEPFPMAKTTSSAKPSSGIAQSAAAKRPADALCERSRPAGRRCGPWRTAFGSTRPGTRQPCIVFHSAKRVNDLQLTARKRETIK
jgi:hypothetical protein